MKIEHLGEIGGIAIVKTTGEELKIKNIWGQFTIEIELPEELSKFINLSPPTDSIKDKGKSWHYLLENGIRYTEDELIVGKSNIREYKINQIN